MGHLNKLQEEYEAKGLTILSVTSEGPDTVEPFIEKFGAEFPVLARAQSGAYSTGGVPSAYLIDVEGKVVWQGHPAALSSDELEGHLKAVDKAYRVDTWSFRLMRQLPPLPDKMSGLLKPLLKRKFGSTLKKAEGISAKLEGEDKEAGEAAVAWLTDRAKTMMDEAAKLIEDNKVYAGAQIYEAVADEYKGHDLGKKAKDALKVVTSDKAKKLEIKASELLIKLKKEMAGERKAEDKLAVLKPLLSKKYAETLAGQEAAKLASSLGG